MAVQSRNTPVPERVEIRRALLSVYDKTGLVDLAKVLSARGVALVSTGGSAKTLREADLDVVDVSDVTGFPEIMDGRVKTLHPKVHGGLLGIRDEPAHKSAMDEHGIGEIDLLVSNLYPFEEVVRSGVTYAEIVENIDIGGPAMIRAAAKNHAYVTVLTNPLDYDDFLSHLEANDGAIPYVKRQEFAQKSFALLALYNARIADWMAQTHASSAPVHRVFGGTISQEMRYGENPHQKAALYLDGSSRPGAAAARQVQGKELSYNNINDTDAAFELVSEFNPAADAAVAIIKHANPCGVATGSTLAATYDAALACDPVSAFGGIVAVNRPLDAEAARKIVEVFTEVIIAPGADEAALEVIAAKKNLRLLLTDSLADPRAPGTMVKSVAGGLLVQDRDGGNIDDLDLKVVTKRAPTDTEMADLKFAFRVAKHVKSNAIVYVHNGATVGIGAGQMSRVDSSRIAARKAQDAAEAAGWDEPKTKGSVVASDAFFPFADGLMSAVEAGATAVIQPGGSMRDDEVVAAANAAGIAMVFTGMRHFRH